MYKEIFVKALKISWRNKHLWVLGTMALFLSIGGSYDTLLQLGRGQYEVYLPSFYVQFFQESINLQLVSLIIKQNAVAFWIACAMLVLIGAGLLVLIWLGAICRVAILSELYAKFSKNKYDTKTKFLSDDLTASFAKGKTRWFPVVGYVVLSRIAFFICAFFIALILKNTINKHADWRYFTVFVLGTGGVIFIDIIVNYAIIFIAGANESFGKAFKSSILFFKNNFKASMMTILSVVSVQIMSIIVMLVGSYLLAIPFILLAALLQTGGVEANFWLVMSPYMIILAGFSVLIGAFASVIESAIWVGTVTTLNKSLNKK